MVTVFLLLVNKHWNVAEFDLRFALIGTKCLIYLKILKKIV